MARSLIFAVLVACLVVSAMGLTMKVEPKTEECFSENLNIGDDVEVRWGVQDGGLLDIDVRVRQNDIN
jgi:TFIIF-interacting CTD phosphatase-like protein